MGMDGIIMNGPTFDEGNLIGRDNFIENGLKVISHGFLDDFVSEVNKTNQPKMGDFRWTVKFGDEGYLDMIELFEK